MGPKQIKLRALPAKVGNIVVIGALTRCALHHSVYDLKATQMNVLFSSILSYDHTPTLSLM